MTKPHIFKVHGSVWICQVLDPSENRGIGVGFSPLDAYQAYVRVAEEIKAKNKLTPDKPKKLTFQQIFDLFVDRHLDFMKRVE